MCDQGWCLSSIPSKYLISYRWSHYNFTFRWMPIVTSRLCSSRLPTSSIIQTFWVLPYRINHKDMLTTCCQLLIYLMLSFHCTRSNGREIFLRILDQWSTLTSTFEWFLLYKLSIFWSSNLPNWFSLTMVDLINGLASILTLSFHWLIQRLWSMVQIHFGLWDFELFTFFHFLILS